MWEYKPCVQSQTFLMFEPFILPQLACRYSCVCLKRWSLPWISSTLFHDYLGNLRARIWLLFSFPIPFIMTLKAFQGRKMRAFCFCLNEYFYCKPGNNQLCVLQIKILMLQKRTVISFSPCLVYLWRGLTFFTLPKQITFCDGILFFPLQPGHAERK